MSTLDRIRDVGDEMADLAREGACPQIKDPLDALKAAAIEVGKAWSGSWFGYQANVYYRDWQPVPPGAAFSQEWGFEHAYSNATTGHWDEWSLDHVEKTIKVKAGNPDLDQVLQLVQSVAENVLESKAALNSLFAGLTRGVDRDQTFLTLQSDLDSIRMVEEVEILNRWHRRTQIVTRDMRALNEGTRVPGHKLLLARIEALMCPYNAAKELARIARHVIIHAQALHIGVSPVIAETPELVKRVFIGHGRSALWRELRDYVERNEHLATDEFNRVPIAGIHNIDRLKQMLDGAGIALLVLTAEDERLDGAMLARQNVVHEVGLFQGRLGFTRAIVLMEESCQEFSNIAGLGQIRFPPGRISVCFHEVREILVRENLLAAS